VASADTALFRSAKKLQYWTGNELFILAALIVEILVGTIEMARVDHGYS